MATTNSQDDFNQDAGEDSDQSDEMVCSSDDTKVKMGVSFTITGNSIYMGKWETPPTSPPPVEGNIYYNTEYDKVFIYIDNEWNELGGGSGSGSGTNGTDGADGLDSTVPGPPGADGLDSTVPGPIGSQGEIGPQGPRGETGARGPAGDGTVAVHTLSTLPLNAAQGAQALVTDGIENNTPCMGYFYQGKWYRVSDNSLIKDNTMVITAKGSETGTDIVSGAETNDDFINLIFTPGADITNFTVDNIIVSSGQISDFIPSLWTKLGADIDGETAGDESGFSVSLSSDGRTVAIGAYLNDGTVNGINSGHVRIYQLNASKDAWEKKGGDIDGEAPGDNSGYSVSLSSDGLTVAIGAYYNGGNGINSGHVRIFGYSGNSWTQLGEDIDGEAGGDYSGISVSLSNDGSTVAIGANGYDVPNGDDSGHVRIYGYIASSWTKLGEDIDGEAANDYSGRSVSLSSDGSTVAIGAYGNDGDSFNAGHVRIYRYSDSSWAQLGEDINGEKSHDKSGRSVSLNSDGSTVAIGVYKNGDNGSNAGHVRIFGYSGNSWTQLGGDIYGDIDGEAADDRSGWSVSLSSDGRTVAIGAPYNDGLNANSSNSGHVRIFGYSGNSWTQLGEDIDGEATEDQSGWSVSLSSDGSTVAIGAQLNDGSGDSSGHVRIYTLSSAAKFTPDVVTEDTTYTISVDNYDNAESSFTWTYLSES